MVVSHIVTHAIVFALVANGLLFLMMVGTSPRVWAYNDYPKELKRQVPPQTKAERRLAVLLGVPWLILTLLWPVLSTWSLKAKLGGEISVGLAFTNAAALIVLATLVDMVILDWGIVCKLTPSYVVLPGTDPEEYKDFTHHWHAHLKSLPALLVVAAVIGVGVRFVRL